MNIVTINTKEELQKVLAIQQSISEAAIKEISTLSHLSPPIFVKRAGKVLEKYARYATLTEFKQMEHLADSEKWGATFGVAVIVSSLICDHAKALLKVESDLRYEYMDFLTKLQAKDTSKINMDALTRLFAILSETYGVIWATENTLALTVSGSRVLLHLLDAHKYLDEANSAVAKFK